MSVEARISALSSRLLCLEKELEQMSGSGKSVMNKTAPRHLDPCEQDTPRVAEVRQWCKDNQLFSSVLSWVPSDYYSRSLQWRRDILKADSISHLCKSIVLENTHCSNKDCSDPKNSRYYMILFQYVERFDAERVMRIVKEWNPTLGKKKFNFRLASSEVSEQLTGFAHGAVVPFCTPTKIPLIMSSSILSLSPQNMWIGAGHIDCKLRVDIDEFMSIIQPHVASFTVPLTEDELSHITD